MRSLQFCYPILLHLFLFHLLSHFSSSLPLCRHHQSSALLHFKNSFSLNSSASVLSFPSGYHFDLCDGYQASYPKTASWQNGSDCCLWDGVTCDTISGNVIGLDLSCSWLQGTFHQNSTLFQLTHLQTLNLAFNHFNGSPMPSHFGGLQSLVYLNLSESYFAGQIPSTISRLSKLVSLDLSWNYAELRIKPIQWKKLVQNATNLRELLLDDVHMSSIKPSSLSFLMNLSSSLVSLSLAATELRGNLSNSILCLPNLQNLDLSYNVNLKIQLPKFNWSTSLRSLSLWNTKSLGGNLPDFIGHLKSLNYLALSNFELPGTIPPSFGNLSQLTFLSLRACKLQAPIPPSFWNLTRLTVLALGFNNFSGQIPSSLSKFQHLTDLELSKNYFSGPIPNFMFDLVNLIWLDLSSNNLSCHVEFDQFSKLKHLQYLDISNNKFLSISFNNCANYTTPNLQGLLLSSCDINSNFPEFLIHLKNLEVLDLSNNKIRGRISKWSNDFEHYPFYSLNLSYNLLTSISDLPMTDIGYFDISYNMLQGDLPIPSSSASFFSVSNNKLTGNISLAICNASSLQVLNLSHNNLTGPIPQCLDNFPRLLDLDLQMNHLSGSIPTNISKKNSNLKTLKLNGNQLVGRLPQSLVQCKQLQVLDVGENKIEDQFPSWLDSLSELQVLILRANKFYGIIPSRLKAKNPFLKLRIIDLSHNSFSGPLPTAYIKNFKGMKNVDKDTIGLNYLGNNSTNARLVYFDSVVVTMKGCSIELEKILTTFTTIDLSNNLFEGEIPKVFGELISLKGLNLSHNKINGTIPYSLGNLKSLEWLDLSSNKLEGEIPVTLTNLNFLSSLNLSQNQLEGMIPQGKQFNTFLDESYAGNSKLCGFPLSRKCNKDEEQPPPSSTSHLDPEKEEFGFGWKAVALGYGCGVIFGMVMGYVVFAIGKPEWLVTTFEGKTNKMVRRMRSKDNANCTIRN